jgi:hypothetical protein
MRNMEKGDTIEVTRINSRIWELKEVSQLDHEGFWIETDEYFYFDDQDWRWPQKIEGSVPVEKTPEKVPVYGKIADLNYIKFKDIGFPNPGDTVCVLSTGNPRVATVDYFTITNNYDTISTLSHSPLHIFMGTDFSFTVKGMSTLFHSREYGYKWFYHGKKIETVVKEVNKACTEHHAQIIQAQQLEKSLRGNLVAQKQKFKLQIKGLEAALERRHDESRKLKEQRKGLIESVDKLETDLKTYKDLAFEAQRKLRSLNHYLENTRPNEAGFPKAGDIVKIKGIAGWGMDWRKNQVTVASTYLDSNGKVEECFVIKGSDYQFNRHNKGTNWCLCEQTVKEYPDGCYDSDMNLRDPGEGYRWLKIGEKIENGDEWVTKSITEKTKIWGNLVDANCYRRKLESEAKPEPVKEPVPSVQPKNRPKTARSAKKGDVIKGLIYGTKYEISSVHLDGTIDVILLDGSNKGNKLCNFFSFDSFGKSWEFTGERAKKEVPTPKSFKDLKVGMIIQTAEPPTKWVDAEVTAVKEESFNAKELEGVFKGSDLPWFDSEQYEGSGENCGWRFKD